jgi:hypothetical protein
LFLLLASGFSLLLSFSGRKFFAKVLAFDLMFFATVIGVVGLDMYLVLGRNLLVPYVNLVKYDYQLLPPFCWLAASLANKCYSFFSQESSNGKHHTLISSVAVTGLFSLMASLVVNLKILNWFTRADCLLFRAEGGLGYFFGNLSPVMGINPLQILSSAPLANINYLEALQDFGFVLIVISLLWTSRDGLKQLYAMFRAT